MGGNAERAITNSRFDAASLAHGRAVFAVSNGFLGLSGQVIGDRSGPWPLTLVSGVYDELDMFGQIRASAKPRPWLDESQFDTAGRSPAVAALPDPLLVRIFVGDREIAFDLGAISNFAQSLLMNSGVYAYVYDFKDDAGRTTRVEAMRLASLGDRGRAYMRVVVTPRDHDEPIRIVSGIDGAIRSNITSERQFEITERAAEPEGTCRMTVRTPARGHVVAMTVENRVHEGPQPEVRHVTSADVVATEQVFPGGAGRRIIVDRYVSIELADGEKCAPSAPLTEALHANHAAWRALWKRVDVEIEGDPEAQRYLRFCIFHLLAAAPRWGPPGGVPVKLLTGQYYQGNTFYDTDLYIVPFYTFVMPQISRTCQQYRLSGMRHAQQIAERQGHRGLKFAWQAGPEGEECLGDWYWFTRTNIHINADVAYSLMQYARATGDWQILAEGGLELLVGVARYYASRAVCRPDAATWVFDDVAGPDEGHCHSRANFYTNFLAARTLEWAAGAVESDHSSMDDETRIRLAVSKDETAQWRRVATGLRLLRDEKSGVYEQCEGFFGLKPLPPDFLEKRSAWFEPVWEYQAMNQPDVLMAMMLFGERFDRDTLRANWECYRDRSLNFSSMSYVVHAIIASRLGEVDEAYRNFIISAGMDVDESLTGRGDTHMGLHGTALGGAWLAAVMGLGGVRFPVAGPGGPVSIQVDPCLPAHWRSLRFKLFIRGEELEFRIGHDAVEVRVGTEAKLDVSARIAGTEMRLVSGQTVRVATSD